MRESLPTHRIALEPRSGIWLLFYETLISSPHIRPQEDGLYKQQLLRIFGHCISPEIRFTTAEEAAFLIIEDRQIKAALIVRDDSQRNVMLRKALEDK